MSKAERTSLAQIRRMKVDQRALVVELQCADLSPAEQAKLKKKLGWKRTREETQAWARELIAEGRMPGPAARELGVGTRYLERLLRESETPQNGGRKPFPHTAETAPTCESGVVVQ
jgi:hypothetical protein